MKEREPSNNPGSFEPAPLSVTLIVGWILIVVIDALYQFYMISKILDSDTRQSLAEELEKEIVDRARFESKDARVMVDVL